MPQPSIREAAWLAVAQQIALFILLGSTTAHEVLWIHGYAVVAFWAGVAVIALRRPHASTRLDVFLVKFGFVPLLLLAMFIGAAVWRARGWW